MFDTSLGLPILGVVGPTAVGKTDLAWWLATEVFTESEVDILVADSRQVYRDIPILSGADLPIDGSWKTVASLSLPYWEVVQKDRTIRIHGVGCIAATDEWSIAAWRELYRSVVGWTQSRNARLLVVAGTGWYFEQSQLWQEPMSVPPNVALRASLEALPLVELQKKVQQANQSRWLRLNHSDKNNPRRLLRILEQVEAETTVVSATEGGNDRPPVPTPAFTVGLQAPISWLEARIEQRVNKRWQSGVLSEVTAMYNRLTHPFESDTEQKHAKPQILTATGVKEVLAYIQEICDAETALALWTRRERQYAKRQLTWFKAHPPDVWVDAAQELTQLHTQVLAIVKPRLLL